MIFKIFILDFINERCRRDFFTKKAALPWQTSIWNRKKHFYMVFRPHIWIPRYSAVTTFCTLSLFVWTCQQENIEKVL